MPAPSPSEGVPPVGGHDYPLTFSVDYPDRSLNRISTALRIFTIIPIAILAATVEGGSYGAQAGGNGVRYAGGGVGILVLPVLLMLLFRKKYPRWWYDWNLQLTRFTNRIAVYLALIVSALLVLFRGAGRSPPRIAIAACFAALVLHTWTYADFLEDPFTWALLAIGVALARRADGEHVPASSPRLAHAPPQAAPR